MDEYQNNSDLDSAQAAKELNEATLLQIRQTIAAIKSVLVQHIGISPARVILMEQFIAREEISQAEIQRKLGVGGAVVTRIIKQMEAEELITRRPDPADNRFTLVRLTEQGLKWREEVLAKARELGANLFQGISAEEIHCLHTSLAQIRRNADSLMLGSESERPSPQTSHVEIF